MTEEEFSEFWPTIVDKKYSTDTHLSKDERTFYAVNCLRGGVPRSSLVGYLENVEAEEVKDAIDGLASLGLTEASKKLIETIHIYLEGDDLDKMEGLLANKYANLNEEDYDKFELKMFQKLGTLENYFMDQDDAFFDALCAHADQKLTMKND